MTSGEHTLMPDMQVIHALGPDRGRRICSVGKYRICRAACIRRETGLVTESYSRPGGQPVASLAL